MSSGSPQPRHLCHTVALMVAICYSGPSACDHTGVAFIAPRGNRAGSSVFLDHTALDISTIHTHTHTRAREPSAERLPCASNINGGFLAAPFFADHIRSTCVFVPVRTYVEFLMPSQVRACRYCVRSAGASRPPLQPRDPWFSCERPARTVAVPPPAMQPYPARTL